jgi:preprotein translocase subunit SecY
MTDAERRIPVQYAKRVVGRKLYGGQNSYIPLKVTMSGVMPIIFAMSIVSIPTMIGQFMNTNVDRLQGHSTVVRIYVMALRDNVFPAYHSFQLFLCRHYSMTP